MKNELFKIASLATILMAGAFVSCNESELDPDKGQRSGKKISFSISDTETKTAYDQSDNLRINWSEGDQVRIFCAEAEDVKQSDYSIINIGGTDGKQHKANLEAKTNGLAWGGNDDTHNFYAVYPADESRVAVDASTGIATFSVSHSQICTVQGTVDASGHYTTVPDMKEAYMVANLSTKPIDNVELSFKPIMTTLEITVQGVNASAANQRDVTLTGISVINKNATFSGVTSGKFKYDISNKTMWESRAETPTTETYYVGIKNGDETWVDLKSGESITLTVFLPPVVIDKDNQVTIQVHATGELSAIIGGKVDKNGKETNIAPSAKAKIALPNMPETKSGNNWITPLDDMIYVQQLSIPRTHDAAAYSTSLFNAGQTQGLDIEQQFELGIRAYDMRTAFRADGIGSQSGEMWMWHGITNCGISLESVMTTLSNALKNNPGEFVILQFRHENELPASYKRTKKWDEIYNVLHKFDSQIVQWRPDLIIKNCRGKFIIFTRDDYTNRTKAALAAPYPSGNTFTSTLSNINGESTHYYVQDYYEYDGDLGKEKNRQIKALYETTRTFSDESSQYFIEKAWALNHTSGYDQSASILPGTTSCYQKNASQVHKPIYEALSKETVFGPTGIVFMDWVGTREASSYTVYGDLLPQAIIDHNYKYRMLRATAQGTNN